MDPLLIYVSNNLLILLQSLSNLTTYPNCYDDVPLYINSPPNVLVDPKLNDLYRGGTTLICGV